MKKTALIKRCRAAAGEFRVRHSANSHSVVARSGRSVAGPLCVLVALWLLPSFARSQEDSAEVKDFSKTNSITIFLGEAEGRRGITGRGLEFRTRGRETRTSVENLQGIPCRCLHLSEEGVSKGYFPFTIDSTFKDRDVAKVRIEVDYFDGSAGESGVFGIQYDAKGSDQNPALTVKQILPNVVLKGSGNWLKATFHLSDAGFKNSQNGRGDFRLWASPPELCVSRLTITLDPSQPSTPTNAPLTFNVAGEAKLLDWNLQWDSGAKPAFSSQRDKNGIRMLIIRASDAFAVGSWRTSVMLEPGDYEFVGKVRAEGILSEPDDARSGVTLRVSGKYGAKMVTEAPDWKTLQYAFKTEALEYVELVCEFRGNAGIGRFDEQSLKLIRKFQ